MDGMEATTDLFINLIQNNRIIYDKSMKDFKNTRKKEEVWEKIANQSRMTVESAKKRYASLRQKYSREKRNCEVKRRNKTAASRNWVYYERLHFLDSFVHPRSTYTNDQFVEEDQEDTEMPDGYCVEEPNEPTGDASQNIQIDIEAGINIDDFGAFSSDNHDIELPDTCSQLETEPNYQNNTDHQQSDDIVWNRCERITSAYSREESMFEYQPSAVPHTTALEKENDMTAGDIETQPSETCGQLGDANIVDIDNYMSPHPGTSSSIASRLPTLPPYPSRCYDPQTGEIVIARVERTKNHPRMPPTNHQIDDMRNPSQQQQSSSIQKIDRASTQPSRSNQTTQPTASSAATTFRSNQLQSTRRSTIAPTTTSTPNFIPVAPASSKEKRIDAIRQRMESCLTAITNKVSDKAQRSPHAPFLSYLGTKLPFVPKENLPRLERQILDLVDQYAM